MSNSVQLQELEKHGVYFSVPKGISMKPMIYNKSGVVEIHKLEKPPKRYDLVVYTRNGIGVIHRVHHVKDGYYIINGDNCWQKEYVKPEQIAGIATAFYRKGKWYSVDDKRYLLYVHLWTDLFFIRRPVFYCRDQIKRVIRKIKKVRQ